MSNEEVIRRAYSVAEKADSIAQGSGAVRP